MKKICLSILILISAYPLVGQQLEFSTLRQIKVPFNNSVLIRDSFPILAYSIRVFQAQQRIDTTQYQYQDQKLLFSKTSNFTKDSLLITYRILPYPFGKKRSHLDSLSLQEMQNGLISAIKLNSDLSNPLVDFKNMDYSGSFTRGFSFGNRQDLVLNSNFNLQMAGDLGDGIQIKAAITDENIPLQPEGNTQQLQEFDKVYVELSKNNNQLKAGDYELSSPESYFSRYYKKLQGLSFSNEVELGNKTINNQASVAIARGKFARLNLEAIEGNQGPYKLRGAQGERFIIVLSGTERIWLNGQLLKRGIEQDYIIDYNLGELSFTNRQLIRRESRIIVEYDYIDQNYTRTLYAVGSQIKGEKGNFSVNLFSQQDGKNTSGLFLLSEEDRLSLRNAGDNLSEAIVSSIRPQEAFSPARVAYTLVDSLTPCGPEQLLVFSRDENANLFTANFSLVGQGNGLYTISETQVANELVYVFVGRNPETCEPLGDYAPAQQLIPPQSQRLLTVRKDWQFNEQSSLLVEGAWSQLDLNRFSNLDQADNQGLALFTDYKKKCPLSRNKNAWNLLTNLSYEFKNQNFRALNPYRDPEFLRDWSLADFSGIGQVNAANEHLIKGSWGFQQKEAGFFKYNFNAFLRDIEYKGYKHGVDIDFKKQGWKLQSKSSFLNANTNTEQRRFLRPQIQLNKAFNKGAGWTWGLEFDAEQNERSLTSTDTLLADSYAFYKYSLSLNSPTESKNQSRISYNRRSDFTPEQQNFSPLFRAEEFNLENNFSLGKSLKIQSGFIYRKLELLSEQGEQNEPSGDNFLGRINSRLLLGKGFLRSSFDYDIGGGQEPRRTFSFVKVRKGEGIYIWLDSLYNNDGIIQANEMEISPFPDQAEYVRVSTFSDDFIQTNNVNLDWSVQISPKAIWFNSKRKWQKWLSRFSTQSSLRIARRTQEGAQVAAWNPFDLNVADSSLIAISSGIRNILFFNRGNPIYDIQLGWTDNRRKFVQNTGFESRINASNFLKLRLKLGDTWTSNLSINLDRQESDSEFFDLRDYKIVGQALKPDFSWIPSRLFQIKLKYSLEQKENTLKGEKALANEFGGEMTWNQNAQTSLRARLSYVNINFEGQANSPVGFAMLNGLQVGNNILWNLIVEKQLGNNLRLQLSYEGRKTGTARTVHVGRAQVAAVF